MIQEKQPEVKTVIKVDIHKQGSDSDEILKAIASHNGGVRRIFMTDISGWVNMKNAIYPTIKNLFLKHEWPTTHISEDGGKTFTLSLTWNEVVELQAGGPTESVEGVLEKPIG